MKLINILILFLVILGAFNKPSFAGEIVDDTLQSIKTGDIGGIALGLRRGVDVNYADPDGNTLLMLAARSGSVEAVALLINAGAKVFPSNAFGDTALLLASFAGNEPIVDILLSKGGSLGASSRGWAPLHYAAFAGHLRLVNKFLDLGGNINATTEIALTPLMIAAMNGHLDIVKTLLKRGADATLRDGHERNARDHALARGNTTIAERLGQAPARGKP